MKRIITAGAAAVIAIMAFNTGTTSPAAADWCLYRAHSPLLARWDSSIQGDAFALKLSRACARAQRRCIRKLRRAWKAGRAQTFGCAKRAYADY